MNPFRLFNAERRRLSVALSFMLLLLPGSALAEGQQRSAGNANLENLSAREILHTLADGVERFTLSNGLRVVLFRRTQAPVFTGHIWVKVGGVNEVPGETGVAHLLEHMAFKGSETIGTKDYEKERELLAKYESLLARVENSEEESLRDELRAVTAELESLWVNNEFSLIYQKRGAVGLNAATSKDYTYYTVSLPNSAFELWCWMESDRMLNPVFRQFYKEREVVREERRMRTDDSPSGKLYEALLATAFWSHPNRLPVIGWPSDLAQLHTADIERFYRTYYRPDNMVIGLVGDLDVATVKPMLEKYFSRVPRATSPLPSVRTREEPQKGERTAVVRFDAQPVVAVAYHKPVYPNKDDLQFAVVHSLLSEGRSSILYRELVLEKKIATSIATSEAPGELFPSLFYVWGTPSEGVETETLVKEIQAILERIKTEPVRESDLEAAKKRVRVDMLNNMTSNDGLAQTLSHAEVLWGDWQVLFEMYDTILQTKAEDVQRLARTYFTVNNRTVVRLERPEKEPKE